MADAVEIGAERDIVRIEAGSPARRLGQIDTPDKPILIGPDGKHQAIRVQGGQLDHFFTARRHLDRWFMPAGHPTDPAILG
jgi:hypothetical protein